MHLTLSLTLADQDATDDLGRGLAAAFPGAATGAMVVCLHGDLGAGKTSCVRSLLHGLGVPGTVRSPTYTLVETYLLPGLTCVHADLYRLRSADEFTDLGVSEYLEPGHLILIEWCEHGGALVPPADLEVTMSYLDAGRRAELSARSVAGDAWLAMLVRDSKLISYLSNLT